MYKHVLVALLLGALLIGGCSNQPNPPAAPDAPDAATKPLAAPITDKLIAPDALLSQTDAEHFLNRILSPAKHSNQPLVGQKICIYAKEDAFCQITITQTAAMTPENLAAGQSPQAIFQALKANFPNAARLADVGDDNFLAPPGLHILKGNYYFTISFGSDNHKFTPEKWRAVGQLLVANLLKNS